MRSITFLASTKAILYFVNMGNGASFGAQAAVAATMESAMHSAESMIHAAQHAAENVKQKIDDKINKEMFIYAARNGKEKEMEKALQGLTEEEKTTGMLFDEPDINGQTPLCKACIQGNPFVVNMLLLAGADKDRLDACGHTPLFEAVRNNHLPVVNVLVEAGANMEKAGLYTYPAGSNHTPNNRSPLLRGKKELKMGRGRGGLAGR